jgi:hypothetical protein
MQIVNITRVFPLFFHLVVFSGAGLAEQTEALPALNASVSKIVFDPRTCEMGTRGAVHTGCGGVVVLIKARQDGVCEFLYKTDGCGGVHTDYRCRVSVAGGPVTIAVENGGITHSFGKEKMTLIRSSGPNGLREVVEVAGEDVVIVRRMSAASEMFPARGDTARFRFRFYTDATFGRDDPHAQFNQAEEFVVESEKMWPWLAAVSREMTVGDQIQVEVPTKIIDGAKKWLSPTRRGAMVYVEVRLVAVERAKGQ